MCLVVFRLDGVVLSVYFFAARLRWVKDRAGLFSFVVVVSLILFGVFGVFFEVVNVFGCIVVWSYNRFNW